MLIAFYRATKFASQNFRRNIWLSIVTIFILTLTLFTISLLAGMNLIASQAMDSIKDKVDIDIFFTPQLAEEKILAAQEFIRRMPEVAEVEYLSQEMALEQFKAQHADDQSIQNSLAELGENPLPASLIIKAKNLDDYQKIIDQFENSEYNSLAQSKDFSDNQMVIDRLNIIIKKISQIGLGLSIIFAFISIIVVFNTVRLAIYSYREELGIMKLVGATNWFIRAPFLLEGIFYALLASLITMFILYPVILVLSPYVDAFFTGYNFNLINFINYHLWQIFALQFLISLILSLTSTSLAISRHLKV